jgi:hypothetical protein
VGVKCNLTYMMITQYMFSYPCLLDISSICMVTFPNWKTAYGHVPNLLLSYYIVAFCEVEHFYGLKTTC